MKHYSLFALAVVSAAGALFTACSSNNSSSTPSVTSLATLPAATGPVTSSRIQEIRPASTGRLLSAWHNNGGATWTSKSGPMCQTGEMIMRLLSDAAQPDKILCYVGAMETHGVFSASYDGNNKYYVLNPPSGFNKKHTGRPAGDMTIKFNIAKTGNAISDFKMWMCETTRGDRAITQSEYVATSLSNGTATVTSVGVHSGSGFSASQRTVATGSFNSSGVWTSKTITNTGSFSGGSDVTAFQNKQYMSLTQASDNFSLNGYFNGYYGGSGNSQEGRMYAKIQGLNLSNLATAALGDGSAKFSFTFPGVVGPLTDTKSWTGDDQTPMATASDGVYHAAVSLGTLPNSDTITAPTFSGAEVWDCDTTGQTVITINMSGSEFSGNANLQAAMLACDSKYNFNNNNMTNCSGASF